MIRQLFSIVVWRLLRAIRVRYEKGLLRLLDNIELREGEEIEIIIARRSFKGFKEKAGKYRFKVNQDIVEEFLKERR